MSQKAITIYTPPETDAHITADDDAFIYDSICGGESSILGSLTCTKIDDNTVRLSGGGVSNQGYVLRIPAGENHDLTIASGTSGMLRRDLVISRFTKNGDDTADTHVFAIIQGTAAASNPVDPTLTQEAIINSGDVNEAAFYRVNINGTSIISIERIAPKVGTGEDVPKIYVQQSQPTNPQTGDLWFY